MLKNIPQVDVKQYYQPGELTNLKKYVVNNENLLLEEKIAEINKRLNKLYQRRR